MNAYKNYNRQQGGYKRSNRNNNRQPQKIFKPHQETFTNFCQNKCVSIDDNIKRILYNQITQQYQFEHKPVLKLENQMPHPEYLVTINKKNKYNFLLFLTRIHNKNYSVFVYNNKGQLHFYSVKFNFSEELYNGTLFKGELVKNQKECWIFYISDLVYYKQQYHFNNRMSNKLQLLAKILKEEYEFDDFLNVCHIQIKSYFTFNHLHFIKKDCQILFIPEHFQDHIYSYDIVLPKKEVVQIKNNEVMEFEIVKTDTSDVYELYDINTKRFDSIACVNKLRTSLYLREQFEDKDSFITKAKYSVYFKSWIPVN